MGALSRIRTQWSSFIATESFEVGSNPTWVDRRKMKIILYSKMHGWVRLLWELSYRWEGN